MFYQFPFPLSVYLFPILSVGLCVCLFGLLSACLADCLSVCLFARLSVSLSVPLPRSFRAQAQPAARMNVISIGPTMRARVEASDSFMRTRL